MGKKKRFPRPRERPFLWCTGLFAVMMLTTVAFGWRFPEQNIVFFNQTASVPVGFYVRVPDRPLARGDYVVYEMTEVTRRYAVARGYVTKPTEPFLKRVGAIAGDSYSIDAETRRFFIDGTYIGDVFERDPAAGRFIHRVRGRVSADWREHTQLRRSIYRDGSDLTYHCDCRSASDVVVSNADSGMAM